MIGFITCTSLALGSFLNVVIYRLPRSISLIRPRSHCTVCKSVIPFYDNIPILSYLILRGHCRFCHTPIHWRYPLIEGLTALMFLALYWKYGLSLDFIRYSILVLFLIPMSVIDIDRGLILNVLVFPAIILGLLFILIFQIEKLPDALLGGVGSGFAVFLIGLAGNWMFRKDSLGMGDVKLIVLIGIYLGFPETLIAFFFGVVLAAFFIVPGLVFRRMKLGGTIPFGPFIAGGTLVHLLFGEQIIQWYIHLL